MNKTVCIDLDGTIAHYEGWEGETEFGDPIPGAASALQKLKDDGHTIIIYTCRANKDMIRAYLDQHSIPYDDVNPEGGKPIADVYADDRGLNFNGDWEVTYKAINDFQPWELQKVKENSMPYTKMSEVNKAIKGIEPPVTLEQANYIATVADAMGDYQHAWPTAINIFKEQFEMAQDDKVWVKRSAYGNSGNAAVVVDTTKEYYAKCDKCKEEFKSDSYFDPGDVVVCAKCGGDIGYTSTKAAASSYRNKLKDSDFLVVVKGANGDVTARHLPITRVAGGKPNRRMAGAAWAALHKGYRGRRYAGPNKREAVAKLKKMYEANDWMLPGTKEMLSDYGMVCLRVPISDAKKLALDVGEPAADMHITLASLGRMVDMNEDQMQAAMKVVKEFASGRVYGTEVSGGHNQVKGAVDGYGNFVSTHKPGYEAVYAHFDSVKMHSMVSELRRELRWAEVNVIETHGFTSHITLAYVPGGDGYEAIMGATADLPMEITFPSIQLVLGADVYTYPFRKKGKHLAEVGITAIAVPVR